MEPLEATKHNARRQTLKAIEHIREARQKLALAFEHADLIENVGQVKGMDALNGEARNFVRSMDALYAHLDVVFNRGVNLAHEIKAMMEQPDHTPPPIGGRYLAYSSLTPLQRHLIRQGYEEIAKASRDAIPKTYYNKMDAEPKPAKVIPPAPITYKPAHKKIPDSRMPL
jgi:hypothetical protein